MEESMSWYKVTLPFKDCGIAGQGKQLQDAFAARLIVHGGRPRDAALFSQTSHDYESVHYYFSPSAMQIARDLIEKSGGVPCPVPVRRLKFALEVGDAGALDILPPPKGSVLA
jgi:hypothetical protein